MKNRRIIVVVLDGVGVGELPDAADFGDVGSNSIANTARAVGGLKLPNMQHLGLGCLTSIDGVSPAPSRAAYGKLTEISKGKDSVIGHWELMGIYSPEPFPVFPNGFPPDLVSEFEDRIKRKIIGNKYASGTIIINELGDLHVSTGQPILYTSADSVFQIAAHEDVIPVEELYQYCRIAREMLTKEYAICRVIARPFIGTSGNYRRTEHRKDWALSAPAPTVLDRLWEQHYAVVAVGKIDDLFNRRGITISSHTANNRDGISEIVRYLHSDFSGLLLANLIDFDMLYGHRNEPLGYADALREFDNRLPEIFDQMRPDDLLIITSDHGNDPVTPSTDHSREYVPLLVYWQGMTTAIDLGVRKSFADVGATIADIFQVELPDIGISFAKEIGLF
jgi:phosphopentomutase